VFAAALAKYAQAHTVVPNELLSMKTDVAKSSDEKIDEN
jgi:hypothetical protein